MCAYRIFSFSPLFHSPFNFCRKQDELENKSKSSLEEVRKIRFKNHYTRILSNELRRRNYGKLRTGFWNANILLKHIIKNKENEKDELNLCVKNLYENNRVVNERKLTRYVTG